MTGSEFVEKLAVHLPDAVTAFAARGPSPDILFYADVGTLIGRRFDELVDRAGLFLLIDQAAAEGDEQLAVGVLTGLFEQLQSVADETSGLWPRIAAHLGPLATSHAEAMNAFFGVDPLTSPSS